MLANANHTRLSHLFICNAHLSSTNATSNRYCCGYKIFHGIFPFVVVLLTLLLVQPPKPHPVAPILEVKSSHSVAMMTAASSSVPAASTTSPSNPPTAKAMKRPAPGPVSIKVTLTQDIFDEIAKLIGPIAKSEALALRMEDQHVKKKIPLLGEAEVATATQLRITKFDIAAITLKIDDGHLNVDVSDVALQAETELRAMGISFGKVVVTAQLDVAARTIFLQQEGRLKTAVYDVKPHIDSFDTQVGTGFAGDVLEVAIDLLERVVKGALESALARPIQTALQDGLDSVLGGNLDVKGGLLNVAYFLRMDIRDSPFITRNGGVQFDIAIDAFVNSDGAVDGLPKANAFIDIEQ
ncbi:hypothetical protein DFJ73DRAFT_792353 [Zopfochytrium polystomum]|nr:hypothetical protein DFJ73DRAFT_792353 [Zopfochytrium polystomum]